VKKEKTIEELKIDLTKFISSINSLSGVVLTMLNDSDFSYDELGTIHVMCMNLSMTADAACNFIQKIKKVQNESK
jgi:hypothetical protein